MKPFTNTPFIAEIRKVEAKKLVSNDVQVTVSFVTEDTRVLDLGKLPSDQLVKVTVEKSS